MFSSSSRFGMRAVGRNNFYMYRTTPANLGYNTDAAPTGSGGSDASGGGSGGTPPCCPPWPPCNNYNPCSSGSGTVTCSGIAATGGERLLICLHDDNNCEHVSFVKSVVRSDVHFQPLNMATPIYRMHSEVKMMLWRMFSASCVPATDASGTSRPFTARKLGHIGIMIYPLVTYDELECILNNVLPMLRGYYCFTPGQTRMDVVVFTLVPTDSCFSARLAVIEETLRANIHVVCLASGSSSSSCTSCAGCTQLRQTLRGHFFMPSCTFEQVMDLTNLVEQLEKKLICLGNVKGLMVSSKMQNIFNRMLYIEDKYRKLHHNIMTETCYDGMLGEIEHIESKIKDISTHIPLSYMQGHDLIQKLTCSGAAALPLAQQGAAACTTASPDGVGASGDCDRGAATDAEAPQGGPAEPVYSYSYARPANDGFFIPGRM